MNDDARREVAIFIEAIKIPLQDRPRYLEIACSGDENLRQKVAALLEVHDRPDHLDRDFYFEWPGVENASGPDSFWLQRITYLG